MQSFSALGIDCWLDRINKIESLCKIKSFPSYTKTEIVKNSTKKTLQSIFDRFYLDEINKSKVGEDLINHNKLRLYSKFKGSFKKEPYIDLFQSRNQRAWLSRLRCSAHHLEIETGRWAKTPISQRFCKICNSGKIGDEYHLTMECKIFDIKRACFIGKMESIIPGFQSLTKESQFKTLLCPTKSAAVKVTNQFLRILFLARDKLLNGADISTLSYPTMPVSQCNCNFEVPSDVENEWESFESILDDSIT
jgi:hypothetical protein